MNAGRLEIELLANMARLQTDMADAKRSVGSAMAGIESSVATAKNALVGLGVAGAVVTFAGTIKGAIDAADQINKLSQRTGLAAEQLSQLQFAAKLSDVSTESLTTGLKKLNVSIAEGLAGDKDKIANFKALGISLNDASGKAKTADQVLMDMADTFSTAKDGAGKTALAVALLGKAGDEMIPLLNGGSGAIKELMERADRLGLTISTDFAQRAEQFNDSLTIVQASSQKLSIVLAGDFVQATGAAMKAMVQATIEGGKMAGMLAGLQTLLTGDDKHKANVAMVDATEKLLAAQDALDKARARGDAATVARLTNRVAMLREEYGLHQRMAQQLDTQAAKEAAAKPQQTKELKVPGKSTGLSDAERARLKEDADRMAYMRQHAYEMGKAVEKANEEFQKQQKILEELAAKQYLEYVTAMDRAVMASVDALGAGMAEAAQYGLLKSQITELTVAKLEAARVSAITPQELAAIDAQIANYRQLIDVQRGMEAAQASRQAAQAAADEWRRATDQIEQALTNALMEGGKNGADYITGLFRTMVLRPIISAAINPLAGAVTTAMGVAGPGAALGGGLSLGSLGTLGMGAANFGAGLSTGFGGLLSGNLMGTLGMGSNLMGAGSVLGGLGTIAGALGPVALGLSALSSLQGGETRGGGQYRGAGLLANPSGGEVAGADVRASITSTMATINQAFERLGSSTRLGEFFSGLETSSNGKGFAYAGGALSTGAVFGQGQNGLGYLNRRGNFDAAGAVTAFGEELSQSVLQALQADLDNLPDYVRKYLDGIDVDAMGKDAADKLLASIDAVATQRATLEQQIYELTTSDAQKLIDTRAKERETIDASNSTLLDRVYALQDEKAAAAQAAAAAQERARIEDQIASQRQNLQTQLWQLEGNTAALRQAELAALDPSNRALQQHIWALQDQAAAADTARAAQDKYNQSLTEANQFLAGVGATIGGYLARLNTTDAGLLSPQTQLVNARELYQQNLALARSGDRGALSNITQYADTFLSASKAYSGSGGATASILDALRTDLAALPAQVRPEQLIVDAVNQTTTAVGTLQTSLLASLQANFGQLDTSLNGTLDLGEFTKGLSKFASEDTLRAVFQSLDANGDGQLTRLEALGQTADKQLAESQLQNRQLEAIGFQQRQLDNIWQRLGGANDYLAQMLQQQVYDAQRQDFQMQQFDAIWRRLGDLASAGGVGGGGVGDLILKVVTPGGTEITNTVIGNLKDRSRNGEIVVYASGVGA